MTKKKKKKIHSHDDVCPIQEDRGEHRVLKIILKKNWREKKTKKKMIRSKQTPRL